MSVVIDPAYVKAGAGALGAEAGDEAGLTLVLGCVDRTDLYPTTHYFHEPVVGLNVVTLEMEV